MSQHVMNVHQFATSWAAKMSAGRGGDRYAGARNAKRNRRATDQPASTRNSVEGTQDFRVPTQSDLSPKNKRIDDILNGRS